LLTGCLIARITQQYCGISCADLRTDRADGSRATRRQQQYVGLVLIEHRVATTTMTTMMWLTHHFKEGKWF
jgi:hypothetical protein